MLHTPDPLLASLSDPDLLTVLLYGECRGEPLLGQIAVANVVQNRMRGRHQTLHGVVLAYAQFSCLWPSLGGANFQRVVQFAERLKTGTLLASERQFLWIASGAVAGDIQDQVNGSTHYFADGIPAPNWTQPPAVFVSQIGHHRFYRNVA